MVKPPPPPEVRPSIKNCGSGCRHKYDVLEFPGVRSSGYLFYCVYCLEFQERIYAPEKEK